MSDFQLHRLGMLMEPEPGNLHEVEGVLNPAVVRCRDGELYLFPRLVAEGDFSRIGVARLDAPPVLPSWKPFLDTQAPCTDIEDPDQDPV